MVRLMYFTQAIALGIGISTASAQTDGNARSQAQSLAGVVKVVSVSSLTLLTLERSSKEIVFGVDPSTRIISKGTAQARDLLLRKPGPRITDIVKAGQLVTITYRQSGRALNAVEVRVHK
jgi:hypothetical protein